jgi:ribonucleoside-diphosphate reductase alpha subunit
MNTVSYSVNERKLRCQVIKRDGETQGVDPIKIEARIKNLMEGLNTSHLNLHGVVQRVVDGIYDGIKTTELDELAAETCAYMNIIHPEYSILAARISISNLHKETKDSIKETAEKLYNCKDKCGRKASLLSEETYRCIIKHHEAIQRRIDYTRDFEYEFFGFKTLEKGYLLKVDGKVVERPQQMIMRVSIGIHGENLEKVFETYDLMSTRWFTHATPTLFNAGTPVPQMSSCFLLKMKSDSIDGIYETLKQCAQISRCAGGIGLSVTNIRAKSSYIRGTNGHSNGIVPMLKVFNDTARYVDQGGGKRKGSFAIYLEPWHADIMEFLQLRRNNGKEELRARDLFYAMWIPDLFMQRVKDDENWTLMCPNECPGLEECWGPQFEKLYTKYEKENRGRKAVKARHIWNEIITSQIETGTPYMLYKDACNSKSNQQNLGCIKSSNLCTEIVEYTAEDEVAVCNLASIALPRFVNLSNKSFDFDKLIHVTKVCVRNLNIIIDKNYYPMKEAENSNMRHRPIGIGVQGLADTFAILSINYDSQEAMDLNEKIFEAIYFAAISESCEISKIYGPYSTFKGSPASKGQLSFDMWGVKPKNYDFSKIRQDIIKHGMRNSLLIAPMPTASTSQILGNTESFEPITSNIYTRRVLSGEFVCVNKHLVKDLIEKVVFINVEIVDIRDKEYDHCLQWFCSEYYEYS